MPKIAKKKKIETSIEDPAAELTGERYPFFKYANDEVTIAMIDRGASSIRARDKTPEKFPGTSIDNIDSLLDDENSPEKETLQAVTTKKGRISLKKIEERGEACLLMGDINRAIDNDKWGVKGNKPNVSYGGQLVRDL